VAELARLDQRLERLLVVRLCRGEQRGVRLRNRLGKPAHRDRFRREEGDRARSVVDDRPVAKRLAGLRRRLDDDRSAAVSAQKVSIRLGALLAQALTRRYELEPEAAMPADRHLLPDLGLREAGVDQPGER